MKAIGCVNNGAELLRAIFTLGLACLMPNDTKKEMMNVKADLKEEQAIMNAISKRMNYFDDLLGSAKTIVKEASGMVDTTKKLQTSTCSCQESSRKGLQTRRHQRKLGRC